MKEMCLGDHRSRHVHGRRRETPSVDFRSRCNVQKPIPDPHRLRGDVDDGPVVLVEQRHLDLHTQLCDHAIEAGAGEMRV